MKELPLDTEAFVAALSREAATVAQTAEATELDRRVPTCPDWTVENLVGHLGTIYRWVDETVQSGQRVDLRTFPGAPAGPGVIAWFKEGQAQLIDHLSSIDPAKPSWVFLENATPVVGSWARRTALETAVHRIDIELAAGTDPSPVDGALASEGIEEFLGQILPTLRKRDRAPGLSGTFHVHASGTGGEPGEWLVDFDAGDWTTEHRHAKADTAVRGAAPGMFLWLWHRTSPAGAGLEIFGPTAVIDALAGIGL